MGRPKKLNKRVTTQQALYDDSIKYLRMKQSRSQSIADVIEMMIRENEKMREEMIEKKEELQEANKESDKYYDELLGLYGGRYGVPSLSLLVQHNVQMSELFNFEIKKPPSYKNIGSKPLHKHTLRK